MWPRKRIDIGLLDLMLGFSSAFTLDSHVRARNACRRAWATNDDSVVCLSVRSGFDLILSELNLPTGSEILVSPITIPGMIQIVKEYGLVPVPVDLEIETMMPSVESLAAAVTSRTRAILVAHLFGAIADLDAIAEFAEQNKLLLFEDCAQGFQGNIYRGHSSADVSMFSFGPIKTATALGGGILRVRDMTLGDRVRRRQVKYTVQSRWAFAKRIGLYFLLKCLGTRRAFAVYVRVCQLLRVDYESVLGSAVRSFPGEKFFNRIRQQPSAPLCKLLRRRLTNYDSERQSRRSNLGRLLTRELQDVLRIPALTHIAHGYWVFPILVNTGRDEILTSLRSHGFDANCGGQLRIVESDQVLPNAEDVINSLVYLPLESEMQDRDIKRIANLIRLQLESSPAQDC